MTLRLPFLAATPVPGLHQCSVQGRLSAKVASLSIKFTAGETNIRGCAGARAFALDTRNKQRWESPPLKPESAAAFREACINFDISPKHILPHGSYLINLGSADPEIARKSFGGFMEGLRSQNALSLLNMDLASALLHTLSVRVRLQMRHFLQSLCAP